LQADGTPPSIVVAPAEYAVVNEPQHASAVAPMTSHALTELSEVVAPVMVAAPQAAAFVQAAERPPPQPIAKTIAHAVAARIIAFIGYFPSKKNRPKWAAGL
jgi:hypothetical protein